MKLFQNRKYIIIVTLLLSLFSFSLISGCAPEGNDGLTQEVLIYRYNCPLGISSCYSNCAASEDANSSGAIDPAEEPAYKSCTGRCDSNCDKSALLMHLLQ